MTQSVQTIGRHRYYSGFIKRLPDNGIFVFGSNPEGRHGAGAARYARQHFGAIYGRGRGIQGRSYALVTKNLTPGYREAATGYVYPKAGPRSVDLRMLIKNIADLYCYALEHPDLDFYVAYQADGRNLNGFSSKMLWELFSCMDIPDNIIFHESFADYRE